MRRYSITLEYGDKCFGQPTMGNRNLAEVLSRIALRVVTGKLTGTIWQAAEAKVAWKIEHTAEKE